MQFEKDMTSEHSRLFLQVREFLLSINGIEEQKKQKITTYSYAGSGLCHLRTTDDGVDIGFLKGTRLEDQPNRLHGKGKKLRVLSIGDTDVELCKSFVLDAMLINLEQN